MEVFRGQRLRWLLLSGAVVVALACGANVTSASPYPPIPPFANGNASAPSLRPPGTDSSQPPVAQVTPLTMSQCPVYNLCLWDNAQWQGYLVSLSGTNYSWTFDRESNDGASSIWNRRTNASWVDKDWPATSPDYVCIGSNWQYPSLAQYGYMWADGSAANDSISSYWLSGSTYSNCDGQNQFSN